MVPATPEAKGGLWSESGLGKRTRPYLKNKLNKKRTKSMVQVVGCLSSKCEALNSIPELKKKKKKGRGGGRIKHVGRDRLE
jgi:hypothetical protein